MRNKIQIIPLGGLEEIGKNMTVVRYKEEIYIIDAGLAFPDSDMYGVDVIIPDFNYLRKNKEKVKKIVITHAHEDHIGALPYLLKEFDTPVYATELTASIIRKKVKDKKREIHIVNENDRIKGGECQISFFRTNHSIPDSLGVVIETPIGNIVHTGDFKFDYTPVDKKTVDFHRMGEIGKQGVLALLSDSTNAGKAGVSMSEEEVKAYLEEKIAACKGRVIVATFASSLHRVPALFQIAKKLNRKVAVFGRTMEDNVNIIKKLGYFKEEKEVLIRGKQIEEYQPHELIVMTTGAQGEPNAGLSRMANGMHRDIKLEKGDTVIFSSSVIPGNEKQAGHLKNRLLKNGVDIVQEKNIHTSGHGQQEEQKLMLSMMKPKYFIPVHGEYNMLLKHKETAEKVGVPPSSIFVCENGSVVEINEQTARIKGKADAGDVLVDDSGLGGVNPSILKDRHRMATHGTAVVYVKFSYAKQTKIRANVRLYGIIADYDHRILQNEVADAVATVAEDVENFGQLKKALYDEIGKIIYQHVKRRPLISLSIDNYRKKRDGNKKD